ncbi:ComF family protein [Streptomyces fuscigenes]|uniref:ComF family protein n=1 Tax=Streptomyces fuscigenes TaxID=1528880 RepID=UPI001F42161B|nr:ComF family protein [Streptomyces fuscigenes]MCF3961659.1 ComF family protein [Streptomyces fuscigenes]
MRGWWREIGGLVLPVACAGCGRGRAPLCEECRRSLYGAWPCRVLPSPEPAGLPAVYAAAPYEEGVRSVLLAHKERGALGLASPLGRALAGAVAAVAPPGARTGPLLLVPVPSARGAVAARGHDAVRRVALAAAGDLRRGGRPAQVVPVLRQRRAVADQVGLGAHQRRVNLAGALEVAGGGARLLAEGRVVLVDDLMTTGASLAEAARAVRAAVGVGTVAVGDGPGGHAPLVGAVVAASPASFEINRR